MTNVLGWRFIYSNANLPPVNLWLGRHKKSKFYNREFGASEQLIDALKHADGSILCRVECRDVFEENPSKSFYNHCKIIWAIESKDLLCEFAQNEAYKLLKMWNYTPEVKDYLKTSSKETKRKALLDAYEELRYSDAKGCYGERDAIKCAISAIEGWSHATAYKSIKHAIIATTKAYFFAPFLEDQYEDELSPFSSRRKSVSYDINCRLTKFICDNYAKGNKNGYN